MISRNPNPVFALTRLGKALRIIGWGGLAFFLARFYGPPILRGGFGEISDGGKGILLGIAIGLLFGYVIGAGKAIVVCAEDPSVGVDSQSSAH